MDKGICLAMLAALPVLYFVFGQIFFLLLRQKVDHGMCLLTGVFCYHAVFQAAALPLIFLKAPLSYLTVLWGIVLAAAVTFWALLRKKRCGKIIPAPERPKARGWVCAALALAVLLQMYYVISNDYLGWDTSYYVGTVATSVQRNSMYRFDGESGWRLYTLPMRYALSSFYMHAAVWCQALRLPAIDYTKIVQGGTLSVLANLVLFELGRFFFSLERCRDFSERKREECAAAMVIAAVAVNFFYRSIYTTSDFLLNRALEAKGYCANFILPFLFLMGLRMWRDCGDRTTRAMLLAASLGCVPLSMSALVTAPALIVIMTAPVLLRERSLAMLRFCLACVLPNAVYLTVYLLSGRGLLVIQM